MWGSGPDDVFAVGSGGTTPSATILHFNGRSWSFVEVDADSSLASVWGSSSNDVFAVGSKGMILHSDGSSWSAMESGTTRDLTGVLGAARCW